MPTLDRQDTLNVLATPYPQMMQNYLLRVTEEIFDGIPLPRSAEEWEAGRAELRAGLRASWRDCACNWGQQSAGCSRGSAEGANPTSVYGPGSCGPAGANLHRIRPDALSGQWWRRLEWADRLALLEERCTAQTCMTSASFLRQSSSMRRISSSVIFWISS